MMNMVILFKYNSMSVLKIVFEYLWVWGLLLVVAVVDVHKACDDDLDVVHVVLLSTQTSYSTVIWLNQSQIELGVEWQWSSWWCIHFCWGSPWEYDWGRYPTQQDTCFHRTQYERGISWRIRKVTPSVRPPAGLSCEVAWPPWGTWVRCLQFRWRKPGLFCMAWVRGWFLHSGWKALWLPAG